MVENKGDWKGKGRNENKINKSRIKIVTGVFFFFGYCDYDFVRIPEVYFTVVWELLFHWKNALLLV